MFTELGKTPFMRDIQLFWHSLFHAKRAAGIRKAREQRLSEMVEAKLELALDDASAALQLPPSHPLVIASVIFAAQREKLRRDRDEEERAEGYPHCFGDF
jgi:hypothetical protein